MKLRYTPEAKAAFAAILFKLSIVNPFAAAKFERKVGRALPRIIKFPKSGPHVPEFRDMPIREFFVGPYRFFYYIDERNQAAWIVSVWHGAQIPTHPRLPTAEPERAGS